MLKISLAAAALLAWTATSLSKTAGHAQDAQAAASQPASLDDLGWMAGEWRGKAGDADVVEWHSDPAGGVIVMAARELAKGKKTFFDFGLITAAGDKVVYTPYPKGNKSVGFTMTEHDAKAKKAVFSNEKHDFPKRFTFARSADNALTITLSGDAGGKTEVYDLKLVVTGGR